MLKLETGIRMLHVPYKGVAQAITDDVMRKEGTLKLWTNLTDLTTFTIHMREKQPWDPKVIEEKEGAPDFSTRASGTWNRSWDLFLGFCQGVIIIVIAIAPWLPIPLVFFFCLWLAIRLLVRATKPAPVVVAVAEPAPKQKKEDQPEAQ